MKTTRELSLDEIDQMPAGRDMDKAVARALGYDVRGTDPLFLTIHVLTTDPEDDGNVGYLEYYSEKIESAWTLVEHLLETGWHSDYGGDVFVENWRDDEWVMCNRDIYTRKERYLPVVYAVAPTAPLAICRAFLKANIKP